MLYDEFENLLTTLESMMSDGVRLIHAGMPVDWDDTVIPALIRHIREKQQCMHIHAIQADDILIDTLTGEGMVVTEIDENTVHLQPQNLPLKYPKGKLWVYFQPTEKGD